MSTECPVCLNVNPEGSVQCLRCNVKLEFVGIALAPVVEQTVIRPEEKVVPQSDPGCPHCGFKGNVDGAIRCSWCKKRLSSAPPSILGLDAGSDGSGTSVAVPGRWLRICGDALASAGMLYGMWFVLSLFYVPPMWNSNVVLRGQGESEFVEEMAREMQASVFTAELVAAVKTDDGDFTSVRHQTGAGIANAIATVLRPLGYLALAPSSYTPVSHSRFLELDPLTRTKLSAGYPELWEPSATIPGFLLMVALTALLIDTGRSVSVGRTRAPLELIALVSLSLLTALVVAGYGPYWMVAVLLVASGLLAILTMAVYSGHASTVAEL